MTKAMEISNQRIEELLEEKFNIELPSPVFSRIVEEIMLSF